MIYLTGDLHGDIERLKSKEMKKLKKGDTLIVCGDFGFVWDGSKKEQSVLKKLGKSKYQILFAEGTHDNLDLLEQYPAEDWNGGMQISWWQRRKTLSRQTENGSVPVLRQGIMMP